MTPAAHHETLGAIVAARPAAARLLDRVGLDYCCHGEVAFDVACAAAGIDADALAREIETLEPEPGDDWTALSPPALADHIVATHHRFLREELPEVQALAAKVAVVHRKRHPELDEVLGLVTELRVELEPHLDEEERVLFPAIHAVFENGRHSYGFGTVAHPMRAMTDDHERAGELLAALRRVTRGYAVPDDGCASYRSLYERLEATEHDTHVHVHKENSVLFPAAERGENATTAALRGALGLSKA